MTRGRRKDEDGGDERTGRGFYEGREVDDGPATADALGQALRRLSEAMFRFPDDVRLMMRGAEVLRRQDKKSPRERKEEAAQAVIDAVTRLEADSEVRNGLTTDAEGRTQPELGGRATRALWIPAFAGMTGGGVTCDHRPTKQGT